MKATIKVELTPDSIETAQKSLVQLLDAVKQKGLISTYSFEIECQTGVITERCVLSEGSVIA